MFDALNGPVFRVGMVLFVFLAGGLTMVSMLTGDARLQRLSRILGLVGVPLCAIVLVATWDGTHA